VLQDILRDASAHAQDVTRDVRTAANRVDQALHYMPAKKARQTDTEKVSSFFNRVV
jgi:hypothetical protein